MTSVTEVSPTSHRSGCTRCRDCELSPELLFPMMLEAYPVRSSQTINSLDRSQEKDPVVRRFSPGSFRRLWKISSASHDFARAQPSHRSEVSTKDERKSKSAPEDRLTVSSLVRQTDRRVVERLLRNELENHAGTHPNMVCDSPEPSTFIVQNEIYGRQPGK